jgi:hypothetical protein
MAQVLFDEATRVHPGKVWDSPAEHDVESRRLILD